MPLWIVKRVRRGRRGGAAAGGAGDGDEAHAKFDKLLRVEMSRDHHQQVYYSGETLAYDPGALVASPLPPPHLHSQSQLHPALRRTNSMVSALSSTSTLGGGGGRGRYERVGTSQPYEDEVPHGVVTAAGTGGGGGPGGVRRSASLVSALSSAHGEDRHVDPRDIPPPTPISEHTPTFTSATVRGHFHQQRRPGSQGSDDSFVPGRYGAR